MIRSLLGVKSNVGLLLASVSRSMAVVSPACFQACQNPMTGVAWYCQQRISKIQLNISLREKP